MITELLKYTISIGFIASLIKFISDKIYSTDVEIALETNLKRLLRAMSDYIMISFFSIIYLIVIISTWYDKKYGYDVVLGADKTNRLSENTWTILLFIILLIIIILAIFFVRDYHKTFFARRVFLSEDGSFILKRINEDYVLLQRNSLDKVKENSCAEYRIKELKQLGAMKVETVSDRKVRRKKQFKDARKELRNTSTRWFATLIFGVLLPVLFLIAHMNKGFLVFFAAIVVYIWGLYWLDGKIWVALKKRLNNDSKKM